MWRTSGCEKINIRPREKHGCRSRFSIPGLKGIAYDLGHHGTSRDHSQCDRAHRPTKCSTKVLIAGHLYLRPYA
jgi:hypothetical protein